MFLGLLATPIAPAATAAPPDPLLPLIHRIESFLHRQEMDGVTADPRFPLNPPEAARLSVVAQALGYADLYEATRDRQYYRDLVSRADFLVDRFAQVTTGSAFDGMLGYALLCAYEVTGDARYFDKGALVARRLITLDVWSSLLNWGMMSAMCLAKYHDLTGDVAALHRTRSILATLRSFQNADGSFPHYCPGTRDVHYTGWLGMELLVVRRVVNDPAIDPILARMRDFLGARVDSAGEPRYTDCPDSCRGDSDGDGVCEEHDRCPFTPGGCAVDSSGCELDVDGDQGCDQGCFYDADGDGACDGHDRCPATPPGCWVDRFGCEADLDGDGDCDPGPALEPCLHYTSRASGCGIDYDTRGWVNELGYEAMLFDHFGDPAYHAVMGFLYDQESHGAVPDKWSYFPLPSDAVYPWGSADPSVIRASVVFWSLAEIYRSRSGTLSVRYRNERLPGIPREIAEGPEPASWIRPAAAHGYLPVDSLVLRGVSPWSERDRRGDPAARTATGPEPDGRSGAAQELERAGPMSLSVASPGTPGGAPASVRYRLAADGVVSAGVFDVAGRRVMSWELGHTSRGVHELRWDCRDVNGRRVRPGVYWIRIRAGSGTAATGRWMVPR